VIVFLAWLGLALAAVPFVLCLSNLLVYRRPEFTSPEDHFAVSVLIPARNEELSIAAAVHSVLASQHLDLEVIVLDDHSEDGTARIVQEIAARDARVRLATAPALPLGWCGKQFACFTLASLSSKPVLCFLDADVRVAPDGLALAKESGSARKRSSQTGNKNVGRATVAAADTFHSFRLFAYVGDEEVEGSRICGGMRTAVRSGPRDLYAPGGPQQNSRFPA
jgi:glycosyltransferase involved in cell wall biosynthesis